MLLLLSNSQKYLPTFGWSTLISTKHNHVWIVSVVCRLLEGVRNVNPDKIKEKKMIFSVRFDGIQPIAQIIIIHSLCFHELWQPIFWREFRLREDSLPIDVAWFLILVSYKHILSVSIQSKLFKVSSSMLCYVYTSTEICTCDSYILEPVLPAKSHTWTTNSGHKSQRYLAFQLSLSR